MNPVILAAKRRPIGSFLGSLKNLSAVDLAVPVATAVLQGTRPSGVTDLILGNVP
jgi:acetyl-CoA C-acetyltransferase